MIFSRYNILRTKFFYGVKQTKFKFNKYFSTSSKHYFISSTIQKTEHLKPNFLENIYGQPTPITHPHLLQKDEIVQGIKKDELQLRREKLMELICRYSFRTNSQYKNHVVVIPSGTKKYMSDKIPYVFRQNSDFLYLTGCLEPDSLLVLTISENQNLKSTLFMRPKDQHAELWDGPRTGVKNSIEFFGVDEAYDINLFKSVFLGYFQKNSTILWYDRSTSDLNQITDIINECTKETKSINLIESPTSYIHKLRVIKSPSEIKLMQKTCEIASECINETMRETKPNDSEHHVFARIDYKCRMRNASYLAYPPVVAAGKNATTIHYINNSQLIKNYDLILMDAGCEYGGYTSDITRTWPANGKFREPQKILYEIVLTVQKELIDTILQNGGKTLNDLFDTMCLKLGKYLREVGLLPNNLSQVELAKAAYSFCPHHVSHYLGMDVHDTPLISRSTQLVPGMVFTIEPGVYIGLNRLDVPVEFRGIGVRIEDDVIINSNYSVQILTEKCFKEIQYLENESL